jgi:hypothetical protein
LIGAPVYFTDPPSIPDRRARLRQGIAAGDRDLDKGFVSPVENVFAAARGFAEGVQEIVSFRMRVVI